MELELTYARFRTTSWTELVEMGRKDEPGRRQAMEAVVAKYWPPVYAYLRGRGLDREAAGEMTQAFFVEVVLKRGLFEKADAGRGRLRSLLLAALKNYRIDGSRRRASSEMVLADPEVLAAEDAKLGAGEWSESDEPYNRRWATAVFEEALRRCEEHFRGSGRDGHWRLFEARVLMPSVTGNEAKPLAEVASEMGFESAAKAAAAVQVVKQRVQGLLREVVAESVNDPEEVEAELAEIRRFLGA